MLSLPLNGRNCLELAVLSSGAVQSLNGAREAGFSAGGMRSTQNNFILDGVDNNTVDLAAAQQRAEMVQPSIDFIQEFKVQTNAYAAEYGHAMGGGEFLTDDGLYHKLDLKPGTHVITTAHSDVTGCDEPQIWTAILGQARRLPEGGKQIQEVFSCTHV